MKEPALTRHLILSLAVVFAVPILAKAGLITQAWATSDGHALTMHVEGFDAALDFIQADFRPGDEASVPLCPCSSGFAVQVIEFWDGIGSAAVNGIPFPNTVPFGEGGFTTISGFLPVITPPYVVGAEITVSFPIIWNLDVLYRTGSFPGVQLFELIGSGTGTGYAHLTISQEDGFPPQYQGRLFEYSLVPEPSTWSMLGIAAAAVALLRRRISGGRKLT